MMKRLTVIPVSCLKRKAAALIVLSVLSAGHSGSDLDIEHGPLKVWGAHEMGMLQGTVIYSKDEKYTDVWLDNFGAAVTKEAFINRKTRLSAGLSGVFRFPKPERSGITFGGSQAVWFYPGPAIAEGTYMFMGDYDNPVLSLSFGSFPYKYNPDAANLGEYLFKSTAYPTTITTGGLMVINNGFAALQGVRMGLCLGNWHTDLLVTTETNFPPFYDWSISLVSDIKMLDGFIELGGGIALKRILPMFADTTSPKVLKNAYFTDNGGRRIVGNVDYYREDKSFNESKRRLQDSLIGYYDILLADPGTPPAQIPALQAWKDQSNAQSAYYTGRIDSLDVILTAIADLEQRADNASEQHVLDSIGASFYTSRNVSLMLRAALDFKKLFSAGLFSEQAFRLYGEIDLLGWKNYGIFYENRMDRVVMMAGVNLPTFKLLDLLALQTEYFNSPYINNHVNIGNGNIPQPVFSGKSAYSRNGFMDVTDSDNWYWSITAKKEFIKGVTFSSQLGRDHMRVSSVDYFYGSREDPNEAFVHGEDWYWMIQLAWGL